MFCVYFVMQCRSITPRLLYAQRSLAFEAQRSVLTQIRELVKSPGEGPALLVSDAYPFVEPGFQAPLWSDFYHLKAQFAGLGSARMPLARRNSKRSLVSSLSVTSPAQSPLLSLRIVDRLPRFSGVSNVPIVPSLE